VSAESTARRAYRLLRGGVTVGHLGEGPGPFVSAGRHGGTVPAKPLFRYYSRDHAEEKPVARILLEIADQMPGATPAQAMEEAARALQNEGYELDAKPYDDLFVDAADEPLYDGPAEHRRADAEENDALSDLGDAGPRPEEGDPQ
jgi:hypothetical protein